MNFYPFNDIETISPRPMLFITGDKAHSSEFSEDAYKRAAEPKELLHRPGRGHVDLYDRVNLIPLDKLQSFFRSASQSVSEQLAGENMLPNSNGNFTGKVPLSPERGAALAERWCWCLHMKAALNKTIETFGGWTLPSTTQEWSSHQRQLPTLRYYQRSFC